MRHTADYFVIVASATELDGRMFGAVAPGFNEPQVRSLAVRDWDIEYMLEPTDELLESIAVGHEITDPERCLQLAKGINGVFYSEVKAQYWGWPTEWTVDGASVDICVRPTANSLDATGLIWIDFAGEVCPYRARIERNGSEIRLTGFLGEVDPVTGRPPRLPQGTLINPVRDDAALVSTPELISGRRASPIAWTRAIEWSSPT